jgi:GT2 family glycosyltransferase
MAALPPPHPEGPDGRTLEWTVVIPAFRGRSTILDCLESVKRALRDRAAEIVVVESSGDGTVDLVRSRFPGVRVIDLPERHSAGRARNRGAEAARGRTIAFVDQDCVVPEDWIDRLEAHLRDGRVGAVGGSIGIRNLDNRSGKALYFLEFLHHLPSRRPPTRDANFLLGCNLACRASLFDDVRFPDRTLAEDVLFSEAVRRRGLDLVYDPSIEVRHWNREGWRNFLAYNDAMGRAAAQYQRTLQRPLMQPFLRFPALVFLSPLVTLPRVAFGLRDQRRLLADFLALSPACLVGNLRWCAAFCREIRHPSPGEPAAALGADTAGARRGPREDPPG